jgi:hypothetical protein
MSYLKAHLAAFVALLVLTGCQTVTNQSAGFTSSTSLAMQRQLDSRRFDTNDELLVLNATVGLLQDLGFKLGETDRKSGLVSGSKGYERGERMYGSDIRVTVTTTPLKGGGTKVRATFQDILAGRDPRFYRAKSVADPKIYTEFFDKLSQSLFLEAHSL